jgi:hypothetical protein
MTTSTSEQSIKIHTRVVAVLLVISLLSTVNVNNANARNVKNDSPKKGTTLSLLETLIVKGKAPKTGYVRSSFSHWRDPDRNGCDARNDILKRDLFNLVFKEDTDECKVISGLLSDPYSGTQIPFTLGKSDVDIDHLVALSHAWQVGAFQWSDAKRLEFANDPLNLLAVSARLNRQKGDGDAATWLPPARSYRCAYVSRQVVVKVKYGLWITRPEKSAIERVLATCPNFLAPTS